MNADSNELLVGPYEALARDIIHITEANWLVKDIPASGLEIDIKVRSNQSPAPARLMKTPDGAFYARLNDPQFGISAGQACVCYTGDRVIGGGWITGAENTKLAA
jgi:tRNA-specific 2-thiouridylase